jgi:hypothetical protein
MSPITYHALYARDTSTYLKLTGFRLMRRCIKVIQSGSVAGPTIASVYPAMQIQDAFRAMQTGMHIGKIVIKMPEDPMALDSMPSKPMPTFRPDRSYLLVGGLGGLGRAVANWMIENGARHLIFLSKSAREGPQTSEFIEELRSQQCRVDCVAGDVQNAADVKRVVEIANTPLSGVIHMAMTLKVRMKDTDSLFKRFEIPYIC